MIRVSLVAMTALCGAAAITATATAPDRIRAHIEFLADDALEGRLAGSRGHTIAARYVASQFAQLGLKPGGANGSWIQPVPLVESTAVIPAAKLTLTRSSDGSSIELVGTEDFLPATDSLLPTVSIRAPLTFVGFGVHAPEQQYDDLAGIDLRGRIAVLLAGAPPRLPTTVRAHYSSTLTKYPALVERGAVGVLTLQRPTDEARAPWARIVQQSWRPRMRWLQADGTPANAFSQLRGLASLSPSGAAKLFAGAPRTLEQVFAAAEANQPQAFELPVEAELTRQSVIGRKSSENVIAILEGSDPQLRNEYVVLSAHLDHVGRGAPVNGDSIYNGALDNASGVAVMLEAARALQANSHRPKRSILFIAVTAEESGLLGSDYFATQPTVPRGTIVANINMDMPVMLAPAADIVAFGAEHSSLGPMVARAARAEGLGLTPDPMPEENIFVRQGIPAVYLDTGTRSTDAALDQAAMYRQFLKDRYHQPGDDFTVAIHYPSLAVLSRVNVRVALDIANTRERPSWNPGNFFGVRFAPKEALHSPPARSGSVSAR